MKIIKYCVYIILMILLIQCSKNRYDKYYDNYESFTEFPITEQYEIKEFADEKFMMPPGDFTIINDKYLVMEDDNNSITQMLLIYDLDTKKCIKKFGRKGKGPGEFINITDIFANYNSKNNFWIYDRATQRFSIFNVINILENNKLMPDTVLKINLKEGEPLDLCFLLENTIVSTGMFINSRLCFYDTNMEPIKTAGKIPGNISDRIEKFMYIVTTNIVKNKKEEKFIFAYLIDDILEMYNFKGEIVKTIHGPDITKPAWLKKKRIGYAEGYTDLCSSSKFIYAVYSGEKRKTAGDFLSGYGKNILVFDWDGNPIKKITTDVRNGDIVISEKRKKLYAMYFDGEFFRIGYYDLEK